jgi:hypothetical protein
LHAGALAGRLAKRAREADRAATLSPKVAAMNRHTLILLLAAPALLAGCGGRTPAPVAAAPEPPRQEQPIASVIDLMDGQIDPAADFIWESVATVSTPKGMVEHQPRTDDEWKEVRRRALLLAEGANLLMMPGRVIAHPGQKLADEGTAGNLTREQAEALLKTDHEAFVAFARVLRDTAVRTLDSIEKRDVDAYLQAGGDIDEACEACHQKFWYPGSKPPPTAMVLP